MLGLAQKGTISGSITDKDANNAPLPFANVQIKGTSIGTTSDENGKFTLQTDAGSYILVFSFLGYETVETPVRVKAGENVKINQALGSGDGVQLQDVVVAVQKRKNTESALLLEMKQAKQVISAISAEQMSKGTDGNAAQAILRVPGITIVDNKFVIVRGLPERYNNVLINNAIAPSTEVDRRTFSFDLIPTNALDKMVIYKTGSADKPGDFAGGVITLTTSENTSEFTKASVGFGYRTNTTFNDQFHSERSSTDFLGFDNGLRTLPSGFPSTAVLKESATTSLTRLNAGRSLANNWSVSPSGTFLNTSVGFGLGRNIKIGSAKLFTTNALNYSQNYQTYQRTFKEVQSYNIGNQKPELNSDFNDQVFEDEVRINVLSNWMLTLNENHKFRFKNLFNQIGENETRIREGFSVQRQDDRFKNYLLGYKSRSIYSSQIEGEHKLNSTNQIDWVLGYNYVRENEPDLRRFRTFRADDDPNNPFTLVAPPSSNLFDNSRYFGNLREFSASNGLNYTYTINRENEEEHFAPIKFKAGYYVDYKYRLFKSRYVSFLLPGYVPLARQNELINLPLSQAFAPDNISQTDGWVLEEGTRPIDSYKADNFLTAGYAQIELPVDRFDITAGLRVENNLLRLRTFNEINQYLKEDKNILSFLPSINIGYSVNDNSQIRAAYSRTVNRPEFREIAPFLFFDFEFNASKIGNPALTTATIDNFDVRYEIYPRKGEVISLGGFYKNFTNPIENYIFTITEQRAFSIGNAPKASNYGVELEVKKSFKDVFNNSFLDRLSLNLNASYIFSEVDLGSDDLVQDRLRPLQGQSPYIINTSLEYADEKGFGVNLAFNRFGDRIFSVGSDNFPSVLEQSRNQLDLSVSKKFKSVTVKATAQNLLDAAFKFYDDTNRDFKIKDQDDVLTSKYKIGTLFNLNLTYDF
jgi:hypothetical protein